MRRILALLFTCVAAVLPAHTQSPSSFNLTVRILDPQSARISGAAVTLYRNGNSTPQALRRTNGVGNAEFQSLSTGEYRVQVQAPGFAAQSQELHLDSQKTLQQTIEMTMAVANADQTVTVTAASVPATAVETSADITVVSLGTLEDLQPVSTGDMLRFVPGAIIADTGRMGSQTSLFVRGGDSDYNKVIVDGVPVAEPGGFYDFGALSTVQFDRIEFLRGTESTLYGSDAMTSVVQVFSRTGSTSTPLLTLGADGGNFSTAHGYGSLSGAWRKFDYNVFGEQFNTNGQGPNDEFSNSTEGGNVGYAFTPTIHLRVRARHNTSFVGDQGEWNFSEGGPLPPGDYNIPPDTDEFSHQNNFLGSADLSIAAGSHWFHDFSGYEYNHQRLDEQDVPLNPERTAFGFPIDFVDCNYNVFPVVCIPSKTWADYNHAGFDYQGQYLARSWARTVFGYDFEDENGFFGDLNSCVYATPPCSPVNHGLRRNQEAFGEELITWKRFSLQAGARFIHNESFGNYGVPRAAASYLVLKGGDVFSGTRLRGSYAEGIKEPNFEDGFGLPSFDVAPNPNLKPEQNRAYEAGVSQSFLGNKYSLDATYYNNQFHNQIEGEYGPPLPPATCPQMAADCFQFINLNRSFAQGAELILQGRPVASLQVQAAYVYTSTEILSAPGALPPDATGEPLLRRPKHSGNLLATYTRPKYGVTLAGTFLGVRPDSDFDVEPTPITEDRGYARLDLGGWYEIDRYVTAYAVAANIFDKHYEDAAGYPGLDFNFRAGLRFTFGGQ
ncbi:MAG: TonB-dependent receptor [Terriglobales bacterium]|jgi:outer membrane cobalamin receptor